MVRLHGIFVFYWKEASMRQERAWMTAMFASAFSQMILLYRRLINLDRLDCMMLA